MNKFQHFSLDEWLYYLENQHQEEIKLGLTRIRQVANRLNLLEVDALVITVAGTNGKGSTVAALEAIYMAAGYQVASYTSPHLLKFNERIRINLQPIADENLCAAFLAIESMRDSTPLTYFEMTTLAALWCFKQCTLDVVILEVGMGGRQDATNIIDNDLAIITTIALDHQEYLGNTIDAIGYEKAGILRANKPFVYGDENPPASIVNQSISLNSQMHALFNDYTYTLTSDGLQVFYRTQALVLVTSPCINHKAAIAAIVATFCLHSILPVSTRHWQQAMKTVFISGRQQIFIDRVTTIVDVAHNPQAASLLSDFIKQHKPNGKIHAVFSALKDKDLCGLIKPLHPLVDFWYPALLTGKRAANEQVLLAAIDKVIGLKSTCFENPLAAYYSAIKNAEPGDLVVVYGSFLTVSTVIDAIK